MTAEQRIRALKRQLRAVRALAVDDPTTSTWLEFEAAKKEVAALRARLMADVAEARAAGNRRKSDDIRALAGMQ